jgi:hypothetical protein
MANEKTLIVKTHDGEVLETSVKNFDAEELNKHINDGQKNTVVIGDLIVYRANLKSVYPK